VCDGDMYRRIAADLRARISSRELPPGTPLPSEPVLAERYGAAPGTVRQVLAVLADEGLITMPRGDAPWVSLESGDKAQPAKTAYRRVMDGLRARIAAGEFGQADRLPSETELMETFGVSRNTARRAYQELVYEGVVVVRHGVGAFPAFFGPSGPPQPHGEDGPDSGADPAMTS